MVEPSRHVGLRCGDAAAQIATNDLELEGAYPPRPAGSGRRDPISEHPLDTSQPFARRCKEFGELTFEASAGQSQVATPSCDSRSWSWRPASIRSGPPPWTEGSSHKYSTIWLTICGAPLIFNHMVDIQESQLDAVFHALGDPTRRMMLRRLVQGEQTVGQLAEPCSMSLAAASKHIKALESAGLISREVLGRIHVCHLNAGPLRLADEWLRYYETFWTARLDRLEELLRLDTTSTPTTQAGHPRDARPRTGLATSTPQRKRSTR